MRPYHVVRDVVFGVGVKALIWLLGGKYMKDLSKDQGSIILDAQGYAVPGEDLIEITARLNAELESAPALDRLATNDSESWPTLFPFNKQK